MAFKKEGKFNPNEAELTLETPIKLLKGVGEKRLKSLNEKGIFTVRDLLNTIPTTYEDKRNITPIREIEEGKSYLVAGKITNVRNNLFGKKKFFTVALEDKTGNCELLFFNSSYLMSSFKTGMYITAFGKASFYGTKIQFSHPQTAILNSPQDKRGIFPVYKKIEGISQNTFRKMIEGLRELVDSSKEWIPYGLPDKYGLENPSVSYNYIHFPQMGKTITTGIKRLIFEELLTLETGLLFIKGKGRERNSGSSIDCSRAEEFIESLGFTLTDGQLKSWTEIKTDLKENYSMNRLLQGDVGSGKTAVAEIALFCVGINGRQGAFMAPTEVLAKQHYETLKRDFSKFGIEVCLLIGSLKQKEKTEALESIKSGKAKIVIGTHALISEKVEFSNLELIITDEQHRFGVRQRSALGNKGSSPNVLVMTATPIPRTLTVIMYGDLDISTIRTMPKGRKVIETEVFSKGKRRRAYEKALEELREGNQVYVVAPLIEESDKVEAMSAESLYEELKLKMYPYTVGLLHGSMSEDEKESAMEAFKEGKIRVLVSTVVIEVGVNVPDATVMIVESAERFGLAQLHQLRGRVGRSSKQSYCFLIEYKRGQQSESKLSILEKTNDGFKIAEEDLKIRGPGEILGVRQHGLPEIRIANMFNHIEIVQNARDCAMEILAIDPYLKSEECQYIRQRVIDLFGENIHIEI